MILPTDPYALTLRSPVLPRCSGRRSGRRSARPVLHDRHLPPAGLLPRRGSTTSITGTVYAPNGIDPLPNVLVYIPNAPVDPFVPGVTCAVAGQPPSGSPIVGATTAVDGTFTIANVPVGTNIPIVFVSGRWRRQVLIPTTNSCVNTPIDPSLTRFPRNQAEGDIPKFAIATGSVDQVECVLRKVGIDDAEFTTPSGSGRINIYTGSAGPGVTLGTGTPTELALMSNSSTLNSYDVLMLPCEGTPGPTVKTAAEYANLTAFANAGGRVYASHYSYQWMDQATTFAAVANWLNSGNAVGDGLLATVDTSFTDGTTLAQWLKLVGAASSANPTTIALSQIKHSVSGINAATTQSYLTLNQPVGTDLKPVEQFVWDAPVGAKTNQCGRVLFNDYHVELGSPGKGFPAECSSTTTMTPQEKLLEYSLFELTNDGGAASLTPTANDFGSVALGFSSAPFTFTWTNNSTFPGGVTSLTATGDFSRRLQQLHYRPGRRLLLHQRPLHPHRHRPAHRRPHRRLQRFYPPRHPHRHRRPAALLLDHLA